MSVFDPLGFLCHLMIAAKILMREVWRREIRWDEPLTSELNDEWGKWRQLLDRLQYTQVPRHYNLHVLPSALELHVFVDASQDAFAAVAYWRSYHQHEETRVAFVSAKTRCAPIKLLTIPRLELQAAVLGTRLKQSIIDGHAFKVNRCILWSDSKTVINWIRSKHRRYKPFVAHRIAEILASTEAEDWRWLPTSTNIADEATRINYKCDLSSSSRWFRGPEFLRQDEESWPVEVNVTNCPNKEEEEEENRPRFAPHVVHCDFISFNRFSSLQRLRRSVAWAIRFTNRCRGKRDPSNSLTIDELKQADVVLWRRVQREAYSEEISTIDRGEPLPKGNCLRTLTPYMDAERVLRVYGRIDAASWLPYNVLHPVILPPDHYYTELVATHHHNLMKHQNFEATIGEIRRQFWIPRLRQVLKKAITNCYVCRIARVSPVPPIMGPLPEDRLTPFVRPFTYTGLDYFGPLAVTIGRRTEKRWVALFTCLTIRAIHLELANDLSTDACIIAIRNFINRRGLPVKIRSDNGKNFLGVDGEAKRFSDVFDRMRIEDEMTTKGVQWIFNCPRNPSEGGVWERMVRCVKRVLTHTLKEIAPREHTLYCFLVEAENVVNSRPLTHLPVGADEDEPLTPNHFLLGGANTAQTPVKSELLEKPCFLRKQWRIARQLRDRFWRRWITEYLPILTRRTKWCEARRPLEEGAVVFICDVDIPRRQWCRGLVERVYKGADGEIRRADVRTATGTLRRPVSKLAVLDMEFSGSERSTAVGMLRNALSPSRHLPA